MLRSWTVMEFGLLLWQIKFALHLASRLAPRKNRESKTMMDRARPTHPDRHYVNRQ